jgi:acetyl-CoA carboxylase carboxyltransferase component
VTLALATRADERLTALERLEVLADPGSLQPLRTQVRSRRMGAGARPGDGVLAAHARVDGRPVYCYAQDASFAGGSLGEAHAETIVEVLRLAGRARVPVLGFIESAGARMQEGLAGLSATDASSPRTSGCPASFRRFRSSADRRRAARPTVRR